MDVCKSIGVIFCSKLGRSGNNKFNIVNLGLIILIFSVGFLFLIQWLYEGLRVAKIVFNRKSKVLIWHGKGRWKAVSGPWGEGALPVGIYKIGRRGITPYTSTIGKSFQGSNGKGFFVPIFPEFATQRGANGGRLGIHPDGGVAGTKGCIGIKENSKTFFDVIAATAPSANLTLEVFDE